MLGLIRTKKGLRLLGNLNIVLPNLQYEGAITIETPRNL
jgi:hypothetical protein